MFTVRLLVSVGALACATTASAQFTPIEPLPRVRVIQVSTDSSGLDVLNDRSNEPTLVSLPWCPNTLVVAYRHFDEDKVAMGDLDPLAAWAQSTDGGRTWTGTQRLKNFQGFDVEASDPVLAIDAAAQTVYWSRIEFCDSDEDDVQSFVGVSLNDGVSWDRDLHHHATRPVPRIGAALKAVREPDRAPAEAPLEPPAEQAEVCSE